MLLCEVQRWLPTDQISSTAAVSWRPFVIGLFGQFRLFPVNTRSVSLQRCSVSQPELLFQKTVRSLHAAALSQSCLSWTFSCVAKDLLGFFSSDFSLSNASLFSFFPHFAKTLIARHFWLAGLRESVKNPARRPHRLFQSLLGPIQWRQSGYRVREKPREKLGAPRLADLCSEYFPSN